MSTKMTTLDTVAQRIDALLDHTAPLAPRANVAEARHALSLLAHVAQRHASAPATQVGEALHLGAVALESAHQLPPHELSVDVLVYLESLTKSYRDALMERVGADAAGRPDMSPVDHAAYYYSAHGMFPPGASRETIVGALKKIAKTK